MNDNKVSKIWVGMSNTYKHLLSGLASAFPGGRVAHPEDQNEEENEENLRENERIYWKMRKDWRNNPILPTRGWEAGCSPTLTLIQNSKSLAKTLSLNAGTSELIPKKNVYNFKHYIRHFAFFS